MEKVLQVEVIAKKLEIKNGANKGKSFIGFKAITVGGKLIDCSFTQAVTNQPKEEGRYILSVAADKMNIDKNSLFPKLWIQEVKSFVTKSSQSKVDDTIVSMFKESLPF